MSTTPENNPLMVKLKNVRLSFPKLFKPEGFKNDPQNKKKYSANFILDKKANAAEIAAMKAALEYAKKEQWKGKPVKLLGVCLREGTECVNSETGEPQDGYGSDVMYVTASNEKPVFVVDQKLEPITAESGKIYAGCYVNAVVRVWAQDNDFGKRLNGSLGNVQKVRDGTPFGEPVRAPEKDFEPIEDESVV